MALIDRIKYDGPPDVLVWKYPRENITMGAQLIVNESQEALFFSGGQAQDMFTPGTFTLSTNNLPGIQKLVNLPFGGQTPFAAEVYYVNRVARLNYKWGTRTPFAVMDPKFDVMLNVGSFGQFGLRVMDSRALVTQLVGTVSNFDANTVLEYFRGAILKTVKSQISKVVLHKAISVAVISAYLEEISEIVRHSLQDEFATYGLELLQFDITSISIPDEEMAKIQKGSFAALEMNQLGDARYQMKRSLEVMETAANNTGAAGSLMAGNVGLGLGMQMAGALAAVGQSVSPVQAPIAAPQLAAPAPPPLATQLALVAPAPAPVFQACASCHAEVPPGAKFCNECGTKVGPHVCPGCATEAPAGSKFCAACGGKL